MAPEFIGFSAGELDTVVVRSYPLNDNFLHPIDSMIFTRTETPGMYITSNDTTFVALNHISGPLKYIMPGHDWQIYLPAINRTISFSAINSPRTHMHCFGDCWCVNPINSFVQDTALVVPGYARNPLMGGQTYVVFIKR